MTHPGHRSHHPERRVHKRFSVVDGLVEPITLRYAEPEKRAGAKQDKHALSVKSQPAVLTDLSAGGMSLIVFMEPPHAKRFEMDLNIPGLNHVSIEGRVLRIHQKGETFNVAVQFVRIDTKHQDRINEMAEDHLDCETRIALNLPDACVPACHFHWLCRKPQKAPHWPPKA